MSQVILEDTFDRDYEPDDEGNVTVVSQTHLSQCARPPTKLDPQLLRTPLPTLEIESYLENVLCLTSSVDKAKFRELAREALKAPLPKDWKPWYSIAYNFY